MCVCVCMCVYVHLFRSGVDVDGGCRCVVSFCAVINEKLITIMNKFKIKYMLPSINETYGKYMYCMYVTHKNYLFSSTIKYSFITEQLLQQCLLSDIVRAA